MNKSQQLLAISESIGRPRRDSEIKSFKSSSDLARHYAGDDKSEYKSIMDVLKSSSTYTAEDGTSYEKNSSGWEISR